MPHQGERDRKIPTSGKLGCEPRNHANTIVLNWDIAVDMLERPKKRKSIIKSWVTITYFGGRVWAAHTYDMYDTYRKLREFVGSPHSSAHKRGFSFWLICKTWKAVCFMVTSHMIVHMDVWVTSSTDIRGVISAAVGTKKIECGQTVPQGVGRPQKGILR